MASDALQPIVFKALLEADLEPKGDLRFQERHEAMLEAADWVLAALRAAPPGVVAAALGWERTGCDLPGCDVCGPDAYRPPAADEGTTE